MKIAYISDVIYPFTKGGAEKRIYELSKCLTNRGHEVHIFGVRWWKGKKEIQLNGVHIHGLGQPLPLYVKDRRSIKEALYFSCMLLPSILKYNFDIIDCYQSPYLHCYPAKVASKIKRISLVFTLHEIWKDYWYEYLGFLGIFGKYIETSIINLADGIVVGSEFIRDELLSIGVPSEKLYKVPNGVDYNEIQKIPSSGEELDVIFAGRLIKAKNVDILLKSVSFMVHKFPHIRVGIIGDGPQKERLMKLANDCQIKRNVSFFGFLEKSEDLISRMKSSKVFVYPSAPEGGTSLAMLEANACALPTVAVKHGKLGSSTELIKDCYNGLLVNELSPELIAEKVLLLLENRELRDKMKRNATTFAKQSDWKNVAILLENVYEKVLRS